MKGFVYHGVLETPSLRALRETLGLPARLSWDLSRFDFSDDLREAGTAFGPRCELRWRRCGEGRYEVLLLACEEVEGIPLQPVEGPWAVEEKEGAQCVNLREAQFNPQFQVYPGANAPQATLRYRVFSKGGVIMFVSPGEVKGSVPVEC